MSTIEAGRAHGPALDPADRTAGEEPALPLPVDCETLRRLLGGGCITCGAEQQLAPAGHRYTTGADGGRLGWPVVACPRHRQETAV